MKLRRTTSLSQADRRDTARTTMVVGLHPGDQQILATQQSVGLKHSRGRILGGFFGSLRWFQRYFGLFSLSFCGKLPLKGPFLNLAIRCWEKYGYCGGILYFITPAMFGVSALIIFECFSPEDLAAPALSGKAIFIMWTKQGRSVAWRYPSPQCPEILISNSFQISNKCLCQHQQSDTISKYFLC